MKSVNALKGKIRDLSRLLERSERLPADVCIEKERALINYQSELEKLDEEKQKKDIIGKYHMVRFFERRKATRALKKLQKRSANLSPSCPEFSSLVQLIHEAEVDLNYTMYCPLTEKYQSLYRKAIEGKSDEGEEPGEEDGGEEQKASINRPPLWAVVERSMSEGTLQALRDGKLGITTGRPRNSTTNKQVSAKSRKKGAGVSSRRRAKARTEVAQQPATQDDEMGDGGFFEE
ncbi:MAG: 18S rRNA maturation protein [Icmadophila ericetorum]|nr:18S rRNA maturation protein [Icmadophila ericetorum]